MVNEIFKDLVVVELASVLAGPAVGMFFAELGAKVVKFENQNTEGDVTRTWRSQNENKERDYSAYYCSVNYGKETVMSDLSDLDSRNELLEWIKRADIVIANFKDASAKKMKLDYLNLKEIKKDIIYGQIDGYPNGEDKVAFDVVLQAETGYLSMCGQEDGQIAKMPVALIDVMAAHQLKEGILIALLKKMKTGQGSLVRTSLYETAIASLTNQATNWLMNDIIPTKMGSLHPNIAPYGEVFRTKDNHEIVLAIGSNQQFQSLCKVLDLPSLVTHDLYKTNTNRVNNRTELAELLAPQIANLDAADFKEKCKVNKVPMGLIQNLKEVFNNSNAKNMVLSGKDEKGNEKHCVRTVAFSLD